jgi:hypothetical protein
MCDSLVLSDQGRRIMTLMETVHLLGSLGEFLGAIAVLVTIGYLAIQIRQNTKMLRTSIYTNWVGINSESHAMRANHTELFQGIYDQRKSYSDLTGEEQIAYFAHWHHMVNNFESIYLSFLEDTVDQSVFDSKHRNMVWFFEMSEMHRKTWDLMKERVYDRRFIDYVDQSVLSEIEGR